MELCKILDAHPDKAVARRVLVKYRFSFSVERFFDLQREIDAMGSLNHVWEMPIEGPRIRHLCYYPHNITDINLSGKKLKVLHDSLFSRNKLKIFNLSHNRLTEIPEKLTRLKNLEVLDLRGNLIPPEKYEALYAILNRLPKLRIVHFDGAGFNYIRPVQSTTCEIL